MDGGELATLARRYLLRHRVMVLAVNTPQGPWAVPVYYAWWEQSLLFVSHRASRHAQAIGGGALAGAAVTASYRRPEANRGLQMRGWCRPLAPAEAAEGRAAYLARLPFAAPFLAAGDNDHRFYRLLPQEAWWVDNRRGFGRVALPELTAPARMVQADHAHGPFGPMA